MHIERRDYLAALLDPKHEHSEIIFHKYPFKEFEVTIAFTRLGYNTVYAVKQGKESYFMKADAVVPQERPIIESQLDCDNKDSYFYNKASKEIDGEEIKKQLLQILADVRLIVTYVETTIGLDKMFFYDTKKIGTLLDEAKLYKEDPHVFEQHNSPSMLGVDNG